MRRVLRLRLPESPSQMCSSGSVSGLPMLLSALCRYWVIRLPSLPSSLRFQASEVLKLKKIVEVITSLLYVKPRRRAASTQSSTQCHTPGSGRPWPRSCPALELERGQELATIKLLSKNQMKLADFN